MIVKRELLVNECRWALTFNVLGQTPGACLAQPCTEKRPVCETNIDPCVIGRTHDRTKRRYLGFAIMFLSFAGLYLHLFLPIL